MEWNIQNIEVLLIMILRRWAYFMIESELKFKPTVDNACEYKKICQGDVKTDTKQVVWRLAFLL